MALSDRGHTTDGTYCTGEWDATRLSYRDLAKIFQGEPTPLGRN